MRLVAWGVHLLTAAGSLVALLALLAVFDGNAKLALVWLLVALFIDGADGPLARRLHVKERLPHVDGATLDLIVDFLTYVFVPVIFLLKFDLLPEILAGATAAVILFSSLYLFSNRNMKDEDNYFVGFPAIWNIIVIYLYVLETGTWTNLLICTALSFLTFLPFKTVHPLRVRHIWPLTYIVTLVWLAMSADILMRLPHRIAWETGLWCLLASYFFAISIWRTLSKKRKITR